MLSRTNWISSCILFRFNKTNSGKYSELSCDNKTCCCGSEDKEVDRTCLLNRAMNQHCGIPFVDIQQTPSVDDNFSLSRPNGNVKLGNLQFKGYSAIAFYSLLSSTRPPHPTSILVSHNSLYLKLQLHPTTTDLHGCHRLHELNSRLQAKRHTPLYWV